MPGCDHSCCGGRGGCWCYSATGFPRRGLPPNLPTHPPTPHPWAPIPRPAPLPPPPPRLQAKLHDRLGQRPESAHYHKLNLDRIDAEGLSGQDAVEALTFLADYHKVGGRGWKWLAGWFREGTLLRRKQGGQAVDPAFIHPLSHPLSHPLRHPPTHPLHRSTACPQDTGDWELAEQYYTRLLDFGAGSKEAAKSSLRELRTLKAAGLAAPRGTPAGGHGAVGGLGGGLGGVGGGMGGDAGMGGGAGVTPVRPDSPPGSLLWPSAVPASPDSPGSDMAGMSPY